MDRNPVWTEIGFEKTYTRRGTPRFFCGDSCEVVLCVTCIDFWSRPGGITPLAKIRLLPSEAETAAEIVRLWWDEGLRDVLKHFLVNFMGPESKVIFGDHPLWAESYGVLQHNRLAQALRYKYHYEILRDREGARRLPFLREAFFKWLEFCVHEDNEWVFQIAPKGMLHE